MAKRLKVSIAVVTYNHEKYIRQALESFISQQTNFSFEVVIADDCSTDKTQEIIKEYAVAYPDIFKLTLRKKNVGVVANFMGAMRAARGKYIALCEGDDYWTDPQKLQTQADFLDNNPDYALCFHRVKVFFEDKSKEEFIFPDDKDSKKFTLNELLSRNFIQTNSVMYRRQEYDDLPKNVMPLDWYLHLYHARQGRIGFIDKVMSAYCRHSEGIWWEPHKENSQFWQKYGLSRISMFMEILKMFRGDKEKEDIIYSSVFKKFADLVQADIKHKSNLTEKALISYPDGASNFLKHIYMGLKERNKKLGENRQILEQRDKQLKLLNEKLQEMNMIRQELIQIKRSRLWKLRDWVTRVTGKSQV